MLGVARFGSWIFAIFFSIAPVLFSIVKDPALITRLLEISSYKGMTKDLIFSAIAIQAVGFVDATETIITSLENSTGNSIAGASIIILIALIIHISLCINWISSENSVHLEDVTALPFWIYSSFLMALSARLLLLVGGLK